MEDLKLLVDQAKKNNSEAIAKIYRQFYKRIYQYCHFNLYHTQDAHDVSQEIFLKFWKALPRFSWQKGGSIQAFFYRIARNTIIDFNKKRKEISLEDIPEIPVPDMLLEKAVKADNAQQLHAALDKLDGTEKKILILRYFHNLSYKELSNKIKVREGTIRIKTYRSLQKLRKTLADKFRLPQLPNKR